MVIGIDEVGRGCWAGPLVAGAVMLKKPIAGLTDSKLLSKIQRQRLDKEIRNRASYIGLGWVTNEEVDSLGLTEAVRLAMVRALDELTHIYSEIIIDGSYNYLAHLPSSQAIIRADLTHPSVSAASIVAKVARDNFMQAQAKLYPAYGFDAHAGYGTSRHAAALQTYGVTPLHRRSYKPVQKVMVSA